MTKIGFINCVFDTILFVLILVGMPTWEYWFAKRIIVVFVLMQFLAGRYQGKSLLYWDELKKIVFSHATFFLVAFVLMYEYTVQQWIDLVIIVVINFIVDSLMCIVYRKIFRKWIRKKVLVVGMGEMADSLVQTISLNPFSCMDILACVDINAQLYKKEQKVVTTNVIDVYEMRRFIEYEKINTIIVALQDIPPKYLKHLLLEVSKEVNEVKFVPQINNSVNFNTKIDDFDGMILLSTSRLKGMPLISYSIKRTLDIIGGLVGVILLIPLTIVVYMLNRKQHDTGPIFFKQERIGLYGERFYIYKYRTMVENAEEVLETMMRENPAIKEEYETYKKLENDPRITSAGHFLRETSLDEFPQLINVLFGSMSLIGPRPYLPREIVDMGRYYETIIRTKPGITGMWQTHGRSEVSFEERLELDDYYAHNWSLWLDITLLIRTISTVLHKVGAK